MPLLRAKLASILVLPAAFAGSRALSHDAGAPDVTALAPATVRVERAAADDARPARGIDVSHHQGRIDWSAVAGDGVRFAFAKATEGGTFTDPAFARNWEGMREAGVLRGAYHRFRPRTDALQQARHFVAVADVASGDLPPVVDVEATDGVSDARLVAGVRTWLAEVERRTGRRPVVYTKPGFRRAHLGTALDDYPLWIAEYGVDSPSHARWAFWQHSERGRVAGIRKEVDLDRFNGSHTELRQFTREALAAR